MTQDPLSADRGPQAGRESGPHRRRVLVSAYACNPESSLQLHPGEDMTGWRLSEQIGRFSDVTVLTHAYNRPGVEAALRARSNPALRFVFLDLPRPLRILYRIGFGQRIYYYLWQIRAWRKARALHREAPFDLAHHLTFGNDWLSSWIGAFLPVPFVFGPVGGGQKTPDPLRREYTLGGRWAERGREAAQWFGRRDWVRRRCLRRARAILVCNAETRARIPARYADKIFFFPVNGISPEDLPARSDFPGPEQPFRVITAGRLHRLKGFALAIRAFGLFAAAHPESEMLVVGQGAEEARLRDLIARLGLGGRVRLVPWTPRSELLKLMASSHVMVFPSFRDGGGAVVVEAMAAGRPVVVLDTAGPGFHIRPEWGIKVPPADPEAVAAGLSEALEALSRDPARVARMGAAARRRVETYYLYERQGDRIKAIHGFALTGRRPEIE